jgi:3-dehydroquinate dehydratase type I
MATPEQSSDIMSANYISNQQTFIIPLTFTDVGDARAVLTRISYGGDIWELRVDFLSPDGPITTVENVPSPEFVREQIRLLQSYSDLPILFTVRTKSQGGKFPDEASTQALELIKIGIEEAVAYVDVEIEWPPDMIRQICEIKGSVKIIASYHSWTGLVRWSSKELQDKYAAADAFGGKS